MSDEPPDSYRRAFVLAATVMVVARALITFPKDDGLRHVGLAFGPSRDWGQVYPHSMFARFADCAPWGGYDLSLRGLAELLSLLPLPAFWQRYLAVELLVLLLSGVLVGLVVRRARLLEVVEDPSSLVLAVLVCATLLALPLGRAGSIRPFLFGTLLLAYSAGQRGAVRGFTSAALLCFLYPYLAWMYTGPVAVAHWLKGCRRFALGTALATAGHLALQPKDFWGLLLELARSGSVRAQLDARIGELAGLYERPHLVAALLLAIFLLWPRLPAPERRLRYEHVLMLFFAPVSLLHVRYFVDVQLPLICVAHGAALVSVLRAPFEGLLARWRNLAGGSDSRIPTAGSGKRRVRALLWVLYPLMGALLILASLSSQRPLRETERALAGVPRDSLVLTAFNGQYAILYARPDLRLVPSSEIGFVTPELREPYLAYVNRGHVCDLATAIGADFFVDHRARYLAPDHTGCLSLDDDGERLRIWRVAEPPPAAPSALAPLNSGKLQSRDGQAPSPSPARPPGPRSASSASAIRPRRAAPEAHAGRHLPTHGPQDLQTPSPVAQDQVQERDGR